MTFGEDMFENHRVILVQALFGDQKSVSDPVLGCRFVHILKTKLDTAEYIVLK